MGSVLSSCLRPVQSSAPSAHRKTETEGRENDRGNNNYTQEPTAASNKPGGVVSAHNVQSLINEGSLLASIHFSLVQNEYYTKSPAIARKADHTGCRLPLRSSKVDDFYPI